jgi:hypothetical protein
MGTLRQMVKRHPTLTLILIGIAIEVAVFALIVWVSGTVAIEPS